MNSNEQKYKLLELLIDFTKEKKLKWVRHGTTDTKSWEDDSWETFIAPNEFVSIQELSAGVATPLGYRIYIRYYNFSVSPLSPIFTMGYMQDNRSDELLRAIVESDYKVLHAEDELRKLIERWNG